MAARRAWLGLSGVLVGAIVVAIFGGVSLANRVTPRPSPTPPTVTVVVAARGIALGFAITADDLTTMTIALAAKPTDAFADPSELVGAIVRMDVQAGQILTRSMLSRVGGPSALEALDSFARREFP